MNNLNRFLFLLAFFSFSIMNAQDPVTFRVESQDFALVFQTDNLQRLHQSYFGPRLKNAAEYAIVTEQLRYNGTNEDQFNMAYTPSGTWNVSEPALQVLHADGNGSTELEYQKHSVTKLEDNVQLTKVELLDPLYKTQVNLFYKVFLKENVFEQWTEIHNGEQGTIELKKYASANLYFRNEDFHLTQYSGSWAQEMYPETHHLTAGIKVLDSKLGTRANLYSPPTFMLSFDAPATETEGKVILANLAWSGNFKFEFERDRYDNLRLIAGANPYAAEYFLKVDESLETPHLIFTYSETGIGNASRNLHRWARKYQVWDGMGKRKTLLNNWEATYFDFDEKKLVSLFEGAHELGVDLFLLDDGWFANKYPRNDDRAGLGDWQENKKKLPNGIGYLVEEAEKAGVEFGIWIEPEMVNPKSELYEQHQDWVIRQPDRREFYYRNQLVLDLSNPEVQDFVFGVFDDLFTQNPSIGFVKWDCNAVIYNAFSDYLDRQKISQSHLYVEYVKGLYKVLDRVRAKYPKVPIMLCSGGGGRVDYGALKYYTEFWPSDNTAPVDRVYMHWDYSRFFPANTMCAHVTEWSRDASIKYRTDIACMGKLGFDIDVEELEAEELVFCKQAVKSYDTYKETLWFGDQYRLQSPYDHHFGSFQFVDESKDHAIWFSYLVEQRYEINYSVEPLRLQGLDPDKNYQIKELNLFPGTTSPLDSKKIYSGDFLMKVGFNPDVSRARNSVVLEITAVK